MLYYRTVADLAKRANLAARNWPDDVLSAVTFDNATLTTALGGAPSTEIPAGARSHSIMQR